jgi:hypothetical protein
MNDNTQYKIIRILSSYLLINLFAVGMLILITGIWPITATGWITLLLFGFPIWLIGEYIGSKFMNDKISKAIDPSEKSISFFRMGYALVVMLIIIVFLAGASYYFKGYFNNNFINWHLTTG